MSSYYGTAFIAATYHTFGVGTKARRNVFACPTSMQLKREKFERKILNVNLSRGGSHDDGVSVNESPTGD
eukprot:scaffold6420_cov168-Amphora_coffeaeformis.AAC.5